MRRTPLLATVVVAAVGCSDPTPHVVESAHAARPAPLRPFAPLREPAPDPALSGVVERQITGRGCERYEIVASAPQNRPELVGLVKVERIDAPPFMARLALMDILHDTAPWTVRVEISRFDANLALPLLTIGETVAVVPVVAIPWLDDEGPRRGASDVVPMNR
jgi:hypothetical protein